MVPWFSSSYCKGSITFELQSRPRDYQEHLIRRPFCVGVCAGGEGQRQKMFFEIKTIALPMEQGQEVN